MLLRVAAIVAVAIFISTSCIAAGPHGIQPGQPLSDTGQVIINDTVAQALADTNAGVVRINFRLGSYSSDTAAWYAAYDGIVDRLRSRGIEVIGLMTNEAWPGVQSQWQENAWETTGGNGWNSYLINWCQMFKRCAAHWQGKIRYWELWNEPDCLAVIYPSNYGALLANAYDLAHTNNIKVEIISGGICGPDANCASCGSAFITQTYDVSINKTGWFTQMKNKWGTYPLDHIGFHIYPNCWTTVNATWLSNYFDTVHNAYTAFEGADTTKKMFLTEIGWQAGGGDCKVSETTQATNLTSAYNVVNSKPYIKSVIWFFLKDEPAASLYHGVFKSTGFTDADKKLAWTNLKIACTFEGRLSAGGYSNQLILDYFNNKGRAAMGNPYNNGMTAWVHNWDFGPAQDYDGGTLGKMTVFDTADGVACAVRGNIYPAMLTNHTTLEFPLDEQFFTGIGDRQKFEGGYVSWTQSGGAQVSLFSHKLILDNSSSGFNASSDWTQKSASDAYNGNYRRRPGTTTNSDPAVWTLSVPQAGYYDVYVRYPQDSEASSSANYEVVHSSGTATVTVNQQARSGRWNRLGTYQFQTGNAAVRLSSQGVSTKYITADAVRLVGPVPGPDATSPTTPGVTDDGTATANTTSLHASWVSEDLESGIERFEYAIGTSHTDPRTGYLKPWTSTDTSREATAVLSLTHGNTYYFYVRAFNKLGMVSSVGVSDGIKVDTTAPFAPVVTDDGSYTGDPSMLHCSWSASDSESGIAGYQYCLGTSQYSPNIKPWTDAGPSSEVWVSGLNLVQNVTYYFTVMAKNNVGKWSSSGVSNGIRRDAAVPVDTIQQILGLSDSTLVFLKDRPVTGLFLNRLFIQESDRTAGISVGTSARYPEGTRVNVTGRLQTSNGERRLSTGSVTPLP